MSLKVVPALWVYQGTAGSLAALSICVGKRKDVVKILFADGTGICLLYKRLDRRVFRVPEALTPGARQVELDECLLDALLDGVDLTDAPKRPARPRRRIH